MCWQSVVSLHPEPWGEWVRSSVSVGPVGMRLVRPEPQSHCVYLSRAVTCERLVTEWAWNTADHVVGADSSHVSVLHLFNVFKFRVQMHFIIDFSVEYLWILSQRNIRFILIFPDEMTFTVPPGFRNCLLSFLWKLSISVGSFGSDCLLMTLSRYICHFWLLI